jgi:hypothetical protein
VLPARLRKARCFVCQYFLLRLHGLLHWTPFILGACDYTAQWEEGMQESFFSLEDLIYALRLHCLAETPHLSWKTMSKRRFSTKLSLIPAILAMSLVLPASADNLLQGGVQEQGAAPTRTLERQVDMQPPQVQPPAQQPPPAQGGPLLPPMQGQSWNQQYPMQGQVWTQQFPPLQGQLGSQQFAPLQGQVGAQQFPPLQGQIGGQQFSPLQGQFATQQFPPLQGQGRTSMLQAGTSGGEEAYGVLGAVVSEDTGMIKSVFPESDLNRFGIHPGDRVAGISGHRYDPSTWQAECRGAPGTVMELVIVHDGVVSNYPVKRTDSRALAGNGSYYRKWAKRTRSW